MKKKTSEEKVLNVFEGPEAVLNFLNPDNAPCTPLVEIPDHLNPYRQNGIRIFAKLMNTLPLANIKSLPAYNMLLNQKKRGPLPNTIIENSSGNTILSLTIIARLLGISSTKAICSHQVSSGKLNLLRLLGTEIIVNEEPICPDPSDPTSGIYKAKIWSEKNNWFNPGQYDNPANPEAHYKWTGPQIWEQTQGKISLLSTGLGTTGSIVGIGKFLKEKNKNIEIVGVSRIANNPIPGVRTNNLLSQIAFDWKSFLDYQEEVGTTESYKASLDLCRAGLLVGPSSGFALIGLLNHLSKQKLSGKEKVAVFVCPDSPFPYLNEYFQYLDPSLFPKIENEHLLKEKTEFKIKTMSKIKELEPTEILKILFEERAETIWQRIQNKENVEIQKNFALIDLRNEGDYEDHHIPGAINVQFYDLEKFLQKNKRKLIKNQEVIFVCNQGNTSRLAAYSAEKLGISSISLRGGDAEWSRINLPRVRAEKCVTKFNLQ